MRCVALASLTFLVSACDPAPAPVDHRVKAELPPARSARYVRFEEVTEITGNAWAAIAEFDLMDASGEVMDRSLWKATADSAAPASAPANAIDGDPRSVWHTEWEGPTRPPEPPHSLVIALGRTVKLTGFRYLPRQDGTINGGIAKYRFFLSDDGVSWGEPVTTGDFTNDRPANAAKTVVFSRTTENHPPVVESLPAQSTAMSAMASVQVKATDRDDDLLSYAATGLPAGLSIGARNGLIAGTPIVAGTFTVAVAVTDGKGAPTQMEFQWIVKAPTLETDAATGAPGDPRFVKLEALTDAAGGSFTSVAEFNVIGTNGLNVPRKDWSASADSADEFDPAQAAIDGVSRTHWHSQWNGAAPPLPHSLVIDMKRPTRVSGFKVLPRQDGSKNGMIGRFNFYVSADGVNWGRPVAEGDLSALGAPASEKVVRVQ